jgi:hypothetical protein
MKPWQLYFKFFILFHIQYFYLISHTIFLSYFTYNI